MSKKEMKLVQALTHLEAQWGRLLVYQDQKKQSDIVAGAIKDLKNLFYELLVDEDEQETEI